MEEKASGKVLILGGYLVLYPKYSGVVLSCSASISCTLSPLPTSSGKITVISTHIASPTIFSRTQALWTPCVNPFISQAVETALYFSALFSDLSLQDFSLEISADSTFYTNGKTGLGSSAALVVSIVKSILRFYGVINREIAHFVAQIAHCRAQKKIGSGFDVSAAIYGSHLFRRHISEMFMAQLEALTISKEEVQTEISIWPAPELFSLPSDLHVLLCCADQTGSDTRSLVSGVLNWVTSTNSFSVFDEIQNIIERVLLLIKQKNYSGLKIESRSLKALLERITQESRVDVLPIEIFRVLKEVEDMMQHVVFAAVPGAGGYDAFYFIVNRPSWEEAKEYLLQGFPELCILNVKV